MGIVTEDVDLGNSEDETVALQGRTPRPKGAGLRGKRLHSTKFALAQTRLMLRTVGRKTRLLPHCDKEATEHASIFGLWHAALWHALKAIENALNNLSMSDMSLNELKHLDIIDVFTRSEVDLRLRVLGWN